MPQAWDSAVAAIERLAGAVYGAQPTRKIRGVVHVVSAVQTSDSRLHVIRIGPRAPKSETDFFVLNFWRAHADAILTSAQVVRAEPELSHALQGSHATELELYRTHALGKTQPILCAFLTRSGNLPLEHPVWQDCTRNRVLTTPDRAAGLRAALGERAEIAGIEALDPSRAVRWLREQGAETILIEAGPSVANQFYEPPQVDHLLLSRCEGKVDPEAIGPALPENAKLFAGMTRVSSIIREELSGSWRFERYDRT
jgi:riboflavin biosynthesis pyrimidine reductase